MPNSNLTSEYLRIARETLLSTDAVSFDGTHISYDVANTSPAQMERPIFIRPNDHTFMHNPFRSGSLDEHIFGDSEYEEPVRNLNTGWAQEGIEFSKACTIFKRDFKRFSRARRHYSGLLSVSISQNTRRFVDDFKHKIITHPQITKEITMRLLPELNSYDNNGLRKVIDWRKEGERLAKPNKAKSIEIKMLEANEFDPFRISISDLVMVRAGNSSHGQVFEVIGMRHGGEEVLVAPTDFQRRGNVNRFPKHRLMVVGSSWPKEETIDEVTPIGALERVNKDKFFSLFQIGLEIEGEFFGGANAIHMLSEGYYHSGNIVSDPSVYPQKGTGNTFELNSPIIQSIHQELEFLKSLEVISSKERGAFASKNNTAGTHIHLDFQSFGNVREMMVKKGYMFRSQVPMQEFLRVLNSVEFEKFFFNRYFEYFKTKKFYVRPGNSYCKAFLKRFGFLSMAQDTKPVEIEGEKARAGKYKWLNFRSLERGMGIEFRIFPYLTTAAGVKQVINFTQSVVMEYFMDKVTLEDLESVEYAFLESRRNGYLTLEGHAPTREIEKELLTYMRAFGGPNINYSECSHDLMKFAYKLHKARKETK